MSKFDGPKVTLDTNLSDDSRGLPPYDARITYEQRNRGDKGISVRAKLMLYPHERERSQFRPIEVPISMRAAAKLEAAHKRELNRMAREVEAEGM